MPVWSCSASILRQIYFHYKPCTVQVNFHHEWWVSIYFMQHIYQTWILLCFFSTIYRMVRFIHTATTIGNTSLTFLPMADWLSVYIALAQYINWVNAYIFHNNTRLLSCTIIIGNTSYLYTLNGQWRMMKLADIATTCFFSFNLV